MRLRSVWRFLTSAAVGTVLMLAWVLLLVVWVVPFQFYGLPQARIAAIVTREPFFLAVYAAVGLAAVLCLGARTVAILRRTSRVPSPDRRPVVTASVPAAGEWDADGARDFLVEQRYSDIVAGEGWVWAVRSGRGPLGSLLFHGSFIVLAAAVLVSALVPSFSGSAVVAEGESFSGTSQYESASPTSSAPPLAFAVESITPSFYRDVLLFTRLDAVVRTADGRARRVRVGTPWLPSATGMVRIEDFGYSLELEDRFQKSRPVRTAFKLHAFPSGQVDTFQYNSNAPGNNDKYVFTVAIYGDYKQGTTGAPAVRSFNLVKPRVDVTVERLLSNGERRRLVTHMLVKPGDVLHLPSGDMGIVGVSKWGKFAVTTSPSAPLVLLALLLAAAGLLMRLVFPREEALAFRDDGEVSFSVRRDVYGQDPGRARELADRWEEERL